MLHSDKPLDPFDKKRLKTRGLGSGRKYEPFIKVCIFSRMAITQ